jgi:type I restriction-modification system DNA methylase subunit
MHNAFPSEWLDRLKLTLRVGKEFFTSAEQAAGLFGAQAIVDTLEAGASGVFCVGGTPCAAVVSLSSLEKVDSKQLANLCTVLWNQGELDFLLLLGPDTVEIHTLRGNPDSLQQAARDGKELPSLLAALRCAEQAGAIAELVSGLESGRLLQEYKTQIVDERVDTALINDLEGIRRVLLDEDNDATSHMRTLKERKEQVHDVLLQAMFLLYLEDRGIVGAKYIHAHGNSQADKLHRLLRHNSKDFRRLLRSLDKDCNGGLFADNALWVRHASTLADFLEGTYSFGRGQGRLFRIYHFDHIPVELLSEVYERFLESEDGKKAHGAYYTPRRLAALVVEQVWETLRGHIDAGRLPRVLDPACGSGIFLATLFQRMAGHLRAPSWEELKHLATCLHGLDINATAIRISAFSLSLALLHRRNPKELQERMENEGNILPVLLRKTLHARNFFAHPVGEHYDCIIGNPPWGTPKQQGKSEGELWLDSQCSKEISKKRKYPKPPNRERSWPFIWKSLEHLLPQAPLALLLPSTGFFLNDAKASLVRLLDFARFSKLIDLSDLRFVLFKNATLPTSILYAVRVKERTSHTFAYVCPKSDINAVRGDRILLASEDWHRLSAWHFARNSVTATQRLMWMSPLERRLMDFLETLPTLRALPLLETREARTAFPDISHPDWGMGLGFQSYTGKGKPQEVPPLMDLPYATTKSLNLWVQNIDPEWKPYKRMYVVRKKFVEGFTAPHIVMPLSTTNSRLKACYAEHDFSFNNSLMAITVPDSSEGRATGKFLTAFLNSTFVAWFMGSIGLAVNRPRLTPADLLPLPFPKPEDLPDPEQAIMARTSIVAQMDILMKQAVERQQQLLVPYGEFPSVTDIQALDTFVFSYLGLSPEEINAIQENVTLVRKATQPARGGVIPDLWKEAGQKQWDDYSRHLGDALTRHMAENVRAVASVYAYSRDVAVVRVTRQYKNANGLFPTIRSKRAVLLSDLPDNILERLEQDMGGNMYLQRCVLIVTEPYTYLIKPRQRRFWLTSAAYLDADRIMGRLLQFADTSGGSA